MAEPREVGGDLWSPRGGASNNSSILRRDTCSKRLTTFGWYELESSLVSKSFISDTLHIKAHKNWHIN
jgi:hypothetical protein